MLMLFVCVLCGSIVRRALLDAFVEYVLPSQFDVSIPQEELLVLLRGHRERAAAADSDANVNNVSRSRNDASSAASSAAAAGVKRSASVSASAPPSDDVLFAALDAAKAAAPPVRSSSRTGVKRKQDRLVDEPDSHARARQAAASPDEKSLANNPELSDTDKLTFVVCCRFNRAPFVVLIFDCVRTGSSCGAACCSTATVARSGSRSLRQDRCCKIFWLDAARLRL